MKMLFATLWLCVPAQAALFQGGSLSLEAPRRLFETGRFEQVIAALGGEGFERLRSGDQREAFYYLGQSYERLGRFDKALSVYQLGVKLFPTDINLLTQLGMLLHRTGLEEHAEPVLQKILSIHPNNAAANLGLAEIDHSLGFLDQSAEHYEKALETMSDDAPVWRDYAEVLISARDFKTAELAARRSLAIKDDPETAFDLARAQRASGRLSEALETIAPALARHPQRDDLALALALWQLEAGRYDEALASAERLLRAATPPAAAYWVRACVKLKRDQYHDAVEDLRKAAADARGTSFAAAASRELLKQLGAAP